MGQRRVQLQVMRPIRRIREEREEELKRVLSFRGYRVRSNRHLRRGRIQGRRNRRTAKGVVGPVVTIFRFVGFSSTVEFSEELVRGARRRKELPCF